VLSYPDGTFIPIAIATHALVGLALGAVLFDRPVVGLLAGVAPDADFLLGDAFSYPLVHRGLTHTLLALVVVVAVLGALARSECFTLLDGTIVGAVGAAYGSHVLIDVTTPKGIPLVYPLLTERIYLDPGIGGHAPSTTLVLWVVCLGVVGYRAQSWYALTDTGPDPQN